MEATYIFDVYDIQLQLERLIYAKCQQDESHFHRLNYSCRVTFHEIIKWWLLDRLDHICHFPVTNPHTTNVPADFKSYLWNVAIPLESELYRATAVPSSHRFEWIRATAEVRERCVIVRVKGEPYYNKVEG